MAKPTRSAPMRVALRELKTLRPYADNPRQNEQAVEAVARSIREFGFRQPIVVDKAGVIIVGHTRYKAALALGLSRVPVHVAADLSAAAARAYRLADNATADLAEWDYEKLAGELGALGECDFDLEALGFPADQAKGEAMMAGPLRRRGRTAATPADRALSALRVARGTIIGVGECLRDALAAARDRDLPPRLRGALQDAQTFCDRGIGKLRDCHVSVESCFAAAGIAFRPNLGRPQAQSRWRRRGRG